MTLLSIKEKNLILKQKQNGILEEKVSILTSSPNTQNVPYNTRNPIKSTSNTGANLSGIYYYYFFFMDTSLSRLARGIKLTFHFGRKHLNLNEEVFKDDARKT